jgi:MerR family transcriptional regulator, heat shock protein HspR
MRREESVKIDQNLSISEAARTLGISVHTLRMYEREGLILPNKKRQRRYTPDDMERLVCIRRAINEMKVSIEGIKHIYALVPCWGIVGCSNADRSKCEAMTGRTGGCWTYRHKKNICAGRECRTCKVYMSAGDCSSIKEMIVNSTRDHE